MPRLPDGRFPEVRSDAIRSPRLSSGLRLFHISTSLLAKGTQRDADRLALLKDLEGRLAPIRDAAKDIRQVVERTVITTQEVVTKVTVEDRKDIEAALDPDLETTAKTTEEPVELIGPKTLTQVQEETGAEQGTYDWEYQLFLTYFFRVIDSNTDTRGHIPE